jgi:hypothetical protein
MDDGQLAPHGTRRRYAHRTNPCRCAACREANAVVQAGYRRARTWRQLTLPLDQATAAGRQVRNARPL